MISYVYMGMSEPTFLSSGWYNGIHATIFQDNNFDVEKAKSVTYGAIAERLNYFFLRSP